MGSELFKNVNEKPSTSAILNQNMMKKCKQYLMKKTPGNSYDESNVGTM